MVFIKRVNNADSGSATKWGGDDLDNLDKYLDDVDISGITGKSARIATPTEFRNALLKIWNNARTFNYSLKAGVIGSHVNLELPDLSADGKLVAAGGSNDWGAALQTFRSGFIVIRNPANTNSYIFQTSAIIANRTITIPLLTANDTLAFNNFTAEFKNKTLNIDQNTFKHSTTNNQGDLYYYDSTAGKIIRLGRGSNGQVLKSTTTGIAWGTDETGAGSTLADEIKVYENGTQIGSVARKLNFNGTDFNVTEDSLNDQFTVALASPGGGGGGGTSPDELYANLKTSSGFKYGLWYGNLSPFGGVIGEGLFSNLMGFDVSPVAYINSSSGETGAEWTVSSGTNDAAGWATTNLITMRKLNPDLTFRFQVDENGDNTGSRFYCGFASSPNVSEDSSFLDNLSGILMFKHSSDSFFQIAHNDGSGTMVEDGSILSTDSQSHTLRIFADESNLRWRWQLDGGSINDVSTDIPSSTAQLAVVFNQSDDDSTTRQLRGFWAKMKQQERA